MSGVEPIDAQFLDLVETLKVVVERLEIVGCKILVEVDMKVTAVWQQPVRSDPG